MQDRKKSIGGSDAAAVLGLSRWTTQLEVWAEKVGRVEPKDISDKLPVKLGNMLEDTVAQLFCEQENKKVRRANQTIAHPKYPFIRGNIDRRVVGEDAILECKTASAWKAKEWAGEDIPQEYIIQCLHYLAITGEDKCYLAVLIGNQDFKVKVVERDEKLIQKLIDREVDFWNKFIVPEVMPTTIASGDGSVLYEMFPVADPNQDLVLNGSTDQLIEQIVAMEREKMALEDQIEANKNQIKAMLGDAESGQTDLWRCSWKNVKSSRVDANRLKTEFADVYKNVLKATETRVFRYTARKGN